MTSQITLEITIYIVFVSQVSVCNEFGCSVTLQTSAFKHAEQETCDYTLPWFDWQRS